MKDLETLFVIKTRIKDSKDAFNDVYSKEEFKTYPTDAQILHEMTRWSLLYIPCYASVEKRYRIKH